MQTKNYQSILGNSVNYIYKTSDSTPKLEVQQSSIKVIAIHHLSSPFLFQCSSRW